MEVLVPLFGSVYRESPLWPAVIRSSFQHRLTPPHPPRHASPRFVRGGVRGLMRPILFTCSCFPVPPLLPPFFGLARLFFVGFYKDTQFALVHPPLYWEQAWLASLSGRVFPPGIPSLPFRRWHPQSEMKARPTILPLGNFMVLLFSSPRSSLLFGRQTSSERASCINGSHLPLKRRIHGSRVRPPGSRAFPRFKAFFDH